jgi:hypothetical protein
MLLFKELRVHSADTIEVLRFESETAQGKRSGNRLGF